MRLQDRYIIVMQLWTLPPGICFPLYCSQKVYLRASTTFTRL